MMSFAPFRRSASTALLALATLPLAGCSTVVVLHPAGDVARQQASLIAWSTGLMLLIILPVMAFTAIFAWRYREGNTEAAYAPDWDHSTGLELLIWSAPLIIIIALGALTWVGTHTLDPYRPLARTAPGQPLAKGAKPLEIDAVSLDWKWLFIYPEQGIATVNRLAVPVGRPIRFRLTSSSVMNTFWVPAMAGMIYSMPGMETSLYAVLNKPGRYDGRSGNYSGAGFSDMVFDTYALPQASFDKWVADVRGMGGRLDARTYPALERPSEKVPPTGIASVDPDLFRRIALLCVRPGSKCESMGMPVMNGVAPAVNNAASPGAPAGALLRPPAQKGSAPGQDVKRGKSPGTNAPGAQANRNFSLLERPALPGDRQINRA